MKLDGLALLQNLPEGQHAATCVEAVVKAKELEPNIVVIDLNMPNVNGLEAIQQLQALESKPNILVLTVSEKEHDQFAALEARASGYLLKTENAVSEELVSEVTHVAKWNVLVSPSMASGMRSRFKGDGPKHTAEDQDSTANGPDRSEGEPRAVARWYRSGVWPVGQR